MPWLDRISGAVSEGLASPFVPGQWEYCGDGKTVVREATVSRGDIVLPDTEGRLNIQGSGTFRTDARMVLDGDALRYLSTIGRRLDSLDDEGWSAWVSESPLISDLQDALNEQPLERAVKKKIGYLEAVCLRPKTHLMLEEERLLVARCKRPSSRAAMVLSARSEDWERRTLWGVRPQRILGVVRDELYDIYENRVAVSLVNHLEISLRERIRDVRRVFDLLQKKKDYQWLLENSKNYSRASRILQLWADAMQDDCLLDEANKVLRTLRGLRRRVLALKDSPLYRKIGRVNLSGVRLKLTNIMKHDEDYRRMGELWIDWESYIHDSSPEPDERWRKEQEAIEGFNQFSFLILVRALNSLGYHPQEVSRVDSFCKDGELILDGPLGLLSLVRAKSKIFIKIHGMDKSLEVIPLPAMLESSPMIGGWLESLREDGNRRFILSITADEPKAYHNDRIRLHSLGNQGEGSGLMFSTIAPWDLESVERVARGIRWFVWSGFYGAYPFKVLTMKGWKAPESIPGWLENGDGELFVMKPLQVGVTAWKELADRLEKSQEEFATLEKNVSETKAARERLRMKLQLEETMTHVSMDKGILDALNGSALLAEKLLNCPICKKTSSHYLFTGEGDYFECSCSGCESSWGVRKCDDCGGKIPFIDFSGNEPSRDFVDIDRIYGSDILSIPVASNEYLCPNCGDLGERQDLRYKAKI